MVHKSICNFPVLLEDIKNISNYFIVPPSHLAMLMSVTIEGIVEEILKSFADDPIKTPLKTPVLLKGSLWLIKKFCSNTPTNTFTVIREFEKNGTSILEHVISMLIDRMNNTNKESIKEQTN